MEMPLTISSLIVHSARHHPEIEITSGECDGSVSHSNWRTVELRARKLASALEKLGLKRRERVGTIAMNNLRHLELYFGVSGGGFVCHTINPRLFEEQFVYIVNNAEDQILFVDAPFLPLVIKLRDKLPTLKHIVVMGSRDDAQAEMMPGILFQDELIETGDATYTWPDLDELQPCSLCYTSGTTGNPKGVEYTHRSTVLHSLVATTPDGIGLSARDSVLVVVPMFHVNAWGMPYIAAICGAKLVLPGFGIDGESLLRLIEAEDVTFAAGVPTIWAGLLEQLAKSGKGLHKLTRTIVGGAACPPSMMKTFRDDYGVEVIHGWGMTETSPLGTVNQILKKHEGLPAEELASVRINQGRPPFGVEVRVVDEYGVAIATPNTPGILQIRGHWVVDTYFGADTSTLKDGWFDTGDIATIDEDYFMTIQDRAKDMIKSGGEWISSVELENIALEHASVADAAAVGVPHPKWDERPILLVKPAENTTPNEADIRDHYAGRIASWQVPDRVIVVENIPRNATGKILKHTLRKAYAEALAGSSTP